MLSSRVRHSHERILVEHGRYSYVECQTTVDVYVGFGYLSWTLTTLKCQMSEYAIMFITFNSHYIKIYFLEWFFFFNQKIRIQSRKCFWDGFRLSCQLSQQPRYKIFFETKNLFCPTKYPSGTGRVLSQNKFTVPFKLFITDSGNKCLNGFQRLCETFDRLPKENLNPFEQK